MSDQEYTDDEVECLEIKSSQQKSGFEDNFSNSANETSKMPPASDFNYISNFVKNTIQNNDFNSRENSTKNTSVVSSKNVSKFSGNAKGTSGSGLPSRPVGIRQFGNTPRSADGFIPPARAATGRSRNIYMELAKEKNALPETDNESSQSTSMIESGIRFRRRPRFSKPSSKVSSVTNLTKPQVQTVLNFHLMPSSNLGSTLEQINFVHQYFKNPSDNRMLPFFQQPPDMNQMLIRRASRPHYSVATTFKRHSTNSETTVSHPKRIKQGSQSTVVSGDGKSHVRRSDGGEDIRGKNLWISRQISDNPKIVNLDDEDDVFSVTSRESVMSNLVEAFRSLANPPENTSIIDLSEEHRSDAPGPDRVIETITIEDDDEEIESNLFPGRWQSEENIGLAIVEPEEKTETEIEEPTCKNPEFLEKLKQLNSGWIQDVLTWNEIRTNAAKIALRDFFEFEHSNLGLTTTGTTLEQTYIFKNPENIHLMMELGVESTTEYEKKIIMKNFEKFLKSKIPISEKIGYDEIADDVIWKRAGASFRISFFDKRSWLRSKLISNCCKNKNYYDCLMLFKKWIKNQEIQIEDTTSGFLIIMFFQLKHFFPPVMDIFEFNPQLENPPGTSTDIFLDFLNWIEKDHELDLLNPFSIKEAKFVSIIEMDPVIIMDPYSGENVASSLTKDLLNDLTQKISKYLKNFNN